MHDHREHARVGTEDPTGQVLEVDAEILLMTSM